MSNFFSIGDKALNVAKSKLSVFAGAFMLPISTLAVTALFLSLGTFLEGFGNDSRSWFSLVNIGYILKSFSYPLLHALPLLLCVSFTIQYTKNNGFAVWCSIIAFLSFVYIQSAFIYQDNSVGNIPKFVVLFKGQGREALNLVHKIFGVYTLNTSFFAAVIIGAGIIPYLFNHKANVELPKYLAFFSGKRFLPLLSALYMFPLAILFILFWPYIGTGINKLGILISKTPAGIDSFIFGVLERVLIPFGLHHAFYSPFWFSSLGGDVVASIGEKSTEASAIFSGQGANHSFHIPADAASYMKQMIQDGITPYTSWQGDSFMGISTIGLPGNKLGDKPIFEYFQQTLGLNIGRFTGGKYPAMQFGLPAAGFAMIYAAPKEKRKEAWATIFPGILTSAIIGMTEPLEFLFLFSAPKLFFLGHSVLMGLSFMLMNVLGAHVTSAFSGGIVEFIIWGVIPMQKGTNFYMWIVVGAILAPLYFTMFYYYITKYNIATPGRDGYESTTAVEAAEGDKKTDSKDVVTEGSGSQVPEPIRTLVIGFGGWDNIVDPTNCASRLRYTIKDKNKVVEATLKSAGVIAIKWINDTHVQAIVGPKAENINNEVLKWKDTDLCHDGLKTTSDDDSTKTKEPE